MKIDKTILFVCLVMVTLFLVVCLVGFSVVAIIEICTFGASVGPVCFLCFMGFVFVCGIGALLMKMGI